VPSFRVMESLLPSEVITISTISFGVIMAFSVTLISFNEFLPVDVMIPVEAHAVEHINVMLEFDERLIRSTSLVADLDFGSGPGSGNYGT